MERSTVLTPDDLDALLEPGRSPRVSIYLPVHSVSTEAGQDAIRFKNLIREAEAGLERQGLRGRDAKSLMSAAISLLDDGQFWRSGGNGVAVFASMQITRVYRLPSEFEELVVVGDGFHIKPLLPLVSGNGRYSILALSQSRIRLVQGDRWSASDVTPTGVPTSLEEALRYDVLEKQTQVHTAGPARGAGASRASQFHGHGATERDDKTRIAQFFRQVDSGIREQLFSTGAPLILASVDRLRSLYREANTYPYLVDEGVQGNPDEWDVGELHREASEILEGLVERQRERVAERAWDRLGTGLVASDLREVLAAARAGRVDTLFVAVDRQEWGRFDIESGEVEVAADPSNGRLGDAEDLLDRATADTLLRRGRVFAVPAEQVPGETTTAALLRY
jgi:hypothetical protein